MNFLASVLTPARIAAFTAWRQEPTTIAGFSVVSATIGSVLTGHLTWSQAAAPILGAVIAMVLREAPPAIQQF